MTFEMMCACSPALHVQLMDESNQVESQARAKWAELAGEAKALGVAQERARVTTLLRLGETSGALDLALEAVDRGTPVADMLDAFTAASLAPRPADGDRWSMPIGRVARGGGFRHATTAAVAKQRVKREVV